MPFLGQGGSGEGPAALLRDLQRAADGAVRWVARARYLAPDVLRLPPAQGGYGVPDLA